MRSEPTGSVRWPGEAADVAFQRGTEARGRTLRRDAETRRSHGLAARACDPHLTCRRIERDVRRAFAKGEGCEMEQDEGETPEERRMDRSDAKGRGKTRLGFDGSR